MMENNHPDTETVDVQQTMGQVADDLQETYDADDADVHRDGFSLDYEREQDLVENVKEMIEVLEDVTDDYPDADYHTNVDDGGFYVSAYFGVEEDE